MKKLPSYINGFWQLDAENPFSLAETKLYFFLLEKAIESGSLKESFFCSLLPIMLPKVLPKMTLLRARDKLQQRGLIQYVSGNGKSKKPCYFVCDVTKVVTNNVTIKKEKVSPTPPLKEKEREKENISKDIQKKEREWNLDYALPGFVKPMTEWLEYKKTRKQSYASDLQIRKCYQNLVKLSNNNPAIAQLIVDQSIANNWAGLFQLKNGVNQTDHSEKRNANAKAFQDFINDREQRQGNMAIQVEKPF